MLQTRVINTLKFFDLQDIPLTAFEIHKYLLNDQEHIQSLLNQQWEVIGDKIRPALSVSLATVYTVLLEENQKTDGEIKSFRGYYFLKHRTSEFVQKRLENYLYAVKRERRLSRYGRLARYVPFVRGIGLVGSQAMGQYRPDSDIDILVFTKPGFMWTGRVLVTIYFHLIGIRRYGKHVANRICLNHYVAGPKQLQRDRNIYTASEYLKMRSLYPSRMLDMFRQNNLPWIRVFFPHAAEPELKHSSQPMLQRVLEKLLTNKGGLWLERQLHKLLIRRITQDNFVVVEVDELSFHPHNRKADLFAAFFKR